MFDWDSAESSVAQEVTPMPYRGIVDPPKRLVLPVTWSAHSRLWILTTRAAGAFSRDFLTDKSAESQSNID